MWHPTSWWGKMSLGGTMQWFSCPHPLGLAEYCLSFISLLQGHFLREAFPSPRLGLSPSRSHSLFGNLLQLQQETNTSLVNTLVNTYHTWVRTYYYPHFTKNKNGGLEKSYPGLIPKSILLTTIFSPSKFFWISREEPQSSPFLLSPFIPSFLPACLPFFLFFFTRPQHKEIISAIVQIRNPRISPPSICKISRNLSWRQH